MESINRDRRATRDDDDDDDGETASSRFPYLPDGFDRICTFFPAFSPFLPRDIAIFRFSSL